MKKLLCVFLMCASSVAYAGFDEGAAAYQKGDYEAALKEFNEAAEQDDVLAQLNLGQMYREGKGVPQDDAQAVSWYLKAAKRGVVVAQFILGNMYRQGEGVPQDYVKATNWYLKAAEQGDASAQYNLGVMYANGEGIPQDDKIAYILFNLAASKGNDNAVKGRDIILKQLTPTARMDAQRISTRLYNSKNFATDLRKLLNSKK